MESENWNLLTHWASGFQNFVPALVSFQDIGHQYPPPQTPYTQSCNNSSTELPKDIANQGFNQMQVCFAEMLR